MAIFVAGTAALQPGAGKVTTKGEEVEKSQKLSHCDISQNILFIHFLPKQNGSKVIFYNNLIIFRRW